MREVPTLFNGTVYRSSFVANVARWLTIEGIAFEYDADITCYGGPNHWGKHYRKVDFKLPNERYVVCTAPRNLTERRALEVFHCQVTPTRLGFLLPYDEYISKRKRTRVSEWCNDHGLEAAAGVALPADWIDGTTRTRVAVQGSIH